MKLARVARLFLTVPVSAMSIERHFLELKRKCERLRASTKIETLDGDRVLYSWFSKTIFRSN